MRDAIRGIRQRPGFTALAVLTLALGIGVNGAAIATAYGILLRPLPYESPERIVVVNLLFPDGGDLGFSPSDVNEWLRRFTSVDAAAAYYTRDVTIRAGSRSSVVRAAFVTDRFFDVLGGQDRAAFVRTLLDRTRALPDVRDAGFGSNLPPRTPPVQMAIDVENNGVRRSRLVTVGSATPGVLPALGARFVAGRDFADTDTAAPVVVLSESLAKYYFVDRDPIGETFVTLPRMFGISGAPRIVGVVADVKYAGLDAPAGGAIYLPWSNRPFGTGYLMVRTAADPRRALGDIRRVVTTLDPSVPVPEVLPLDDVAAQSIAGRRLRAVPAAAFALLALAVAAVGVMATLSTLVAERRRDLAICAAVGASRERLLWTIRRPGLTLTVTGVIGGLGAGAAAARGLSSLLYGVRQYDAVTFGGTAAIVLFTSILMTAVCALRALRVEPIAMLRQES